VIPIGCRGVCLAILIPLCALRRGVAVDLQTLFDRSYDAGPYRRRSPYRGRSACPSSCPAEEAAGPNSYSASEGSLP